MTPIFLLDTSNLDNSRNSSLISDDISLHRSVCTNDFIHDTQLCTQDCSEFPNNHFDISLLSSGEEDSPSFVFGNITEIVKVHSESFGIVIDPNRDHDIFANGNISPDPPISDEDDISDKSSNTNSELNDNLTALAHHFNPDIFATENISPDLP